MRSFAVLADRSVRGFTYLSHASCKYIGERREGSPRKAQDYPWRITRGDLLNSGWKPTHITIIVRLLSPEPVGWLQHYQLYSGVGADIVMKSITPSTCADVDSGFHG